jgi:hypothetical protein
MRPDTADRTAAAAAAAGVQLQRAADQLRLLQQCERASGRPLVERHDVIGVQQAHDIWSYARWDQRFSLVEPCHLVQA